MTNMLKLVDRQVGTRAYINLKDCIRRVILFRALMEP